MPTIDILLATYNGAQFLPELLRSLEQQTFTDWQLIVRDDGSTDNTLAVIEDWASRSSRPVRIVDDGRKGLGAAGNFGALLETSDAPHFALCDQDDVWLPGKLSLMLERLKAAESSFGTEKPLIAYSDLRVVDTELHEINPSFRAFTDQHEPVPGKTLQCVMIHNVVTGCASLGNAALRRASLPVPPEAIMHDWWLALVAAATGALVDVPEATVLYRQHSSNTLGAMKWSLGSMVIRLLTKPGPSLKRAKASILPTQRQALTFYRRFETELDGRDAELVWRYGTLHARPLWERKHFALNKLLWPRNFIRNVALLAFI